MNKQSTYQNLKFYQDTAFSQQELEKISSEFLDFEKVLSLSFKYLKSQWQRVYLIPFLWNILAGFVFSLVFIILFVTIGSIQLITQTAPNTLVILAGVIVFIVLVLVFTFLSILLSINQAYLLNNKSVEGVLKTRIGIKKFFPFLGIAVLLTIIFSSVDVILEVIGFILLITINLTSGRNALEDVNTDIQSPQATPLILVYGLFNILAWVISTVFNIWISTRLSHSVYMLVFENSGIINSIKSSWSMTKQYFWKEILRKLLAGLLYGLCLVILIIIPVVIFGISFLTGEMIFIIAITALISLIALSGIIVLSLLANSFNYVSFLNYRLVTTENNNSITNNPTNSKTINTDDTETIEANLESQEEVESNLIEDKEDKEVGENNKENNIDTNKK